MRDALLFYFLLPVNSTHELGPLVDLKIPANKTRWTLKNLNFSTRYKFYFYAQTAAGSGSQITEEAVTNVDEGKMGMYKIHVTLSVMRPESFPRVYAFSFLLPTENPSYPADANTFL